jgi:hypothetical protein
MSTQLRDALLAAFGDKPFDTTSVVLAAAHNLQLAAAIEASLPPSKKRGELHYKRARRVLAAMARQYFETDVVGYWRIKPPVSSSWPDMQVPLPSPARPKEPA